MTGLLEPCPFCGSKKIRESVDGTLDFNNCLWYCEDCGADGPNNNSIDESLNAWNRRASPWVRVEDGLPEMGQEVVVNCHDFYLHKNHKSIAFWDGLYWRRDNGVTFPYDEGQHWMPIPEIEG